MAITINGTANTVAGLAAGGLPDDSINLADLSATGTASSSTYLRGDNSWATVSTTGTTGATDFTIADGNLVVATGHGIDFGAQTGTSATDSTTTSELLDHYEEGTWTPIPKISHVTTGITATVSGAYTKIGRLVHISFKVNFSDKGSNGGQFTVHGLPFAENGAYIVGSSTGGGGSIYYQQSLSGLTVDGKLDFRVESSMIYMQCLNADNATVIPGGGELADDTHFFGHGTYYA